MFGYFLRRVDRRFSVRVSLRTPCLVPSIARLFLSILWCIVFGCKCHPVPSRPPVRLSPEEMARLGSGWVVAGATFTFSAILRQSYLPTAFYRGWFATGDSEHELRGCWGQLEKAVGTLPKSQEETLKTLEAMFNTAEAPSVNPDYPDMHSQGASMCAVNCECTLHRCVSCAEADEHVWLCLRRIVCGGGFAEAVCGAI